MSIPAFFIFQQSRQAMAGLRAFVIAAAFTLGGWPARNAGRIPGVVGSVNVLTCGP